ncbi:hypothetical protein ACSNOB_15735 [Micromonospora sp. URMC 106]|uniref:hypothetical protein n=1 Tax=Micromonospora sp. URMC 106 TaxID=3423408 RepID=UPI003F1C4D5B
MTKGDTVRDRGHRPIWLLAGLLLSLSQVGGACTHPPRPDYQIGLVRIGDRLAVYAPICAGDTITAVQVHQMPDVGKSGDVVLIWDAEGPIGADARAGLIVLGEGFRTVRQAPPAQFDRTLSVAVDTAAERRYSAAMTVPKEPAQFSAGTPVTDMSFDTEDGRVSYDTLRAHFESEVTNCGSRSRASRQ